MLRPIKLTAEITHTKWKIGRLSVMHHLKGVSASKLLTTIGIHTQERAIEMLQQSGDR